MLNKKSRRQKGFTLIELLIVMAIIGLIAAIALPNLYKRFFGAQRDAAAAQIKSIEAALGTYLLDVRKYPKTLDELVTNSSNDPSWNGPYVNKSQLLDPWKNPYQYRRPGSENRDYDIYSFGADGREGGDKDNADITSW
jgi:general secretion pathway protein G